MSTQKREYELKVRAERQQETRRRIAAATAGLHREVGPAKTTIAEVARRAGVQRPTVYNNFPTDRSLFEACSAHFMAENPPPDFGAALAADDPLERIRGVLVALYGWFDETEQMSSNVQRDRHLLPELDALLRETSDARMDELADGLTAGLGARDRRTRADARAAIRLALDFHTWQRLRKEGLSDAGAAELMARAAAPTLE